MRLLLLLALACGAPPLEAPIVEVPADADGDGLLDRDEAALGTDPTRADTDGDGLDDGRELRETRTDPLSADPDADGLSDADELTWGTAPRRADTDGDGLSDGEEVAAGTSPTRPDTDGDGLADGAEAALGADPLRADSDGDGLADGLEHTLGWPLASADTDADGLLDAAELATGCDPRNPDTDGDDLRDGDERRTDPLDPDSDDDGLPDGAEVALGTDPTRPDTDGDGLSDTAEGPLGTDPTRADTDGDRLLDAEELALGLPPTDADADDDGLSDAEEVALGFDPLTADADQDGLSDAEEQALGSDPNAADSDADGLGDGEEAAFGSDPTDPDGDRDGRLDGVEIRTGSDPGRADVHATSPSLGPLVWVPPGTARLGSAEIASTYENLHTVTLTRGFLMMPHELTEASAYALTGLRPPATWGCVGDCPAVSLSWWEALDVANAASVADGLAPCFTLRGCDSFGDCTGITVQAPGGSPYACEGWRLPTEAEWEYAARTAGLVDGPFPFPGAPTSLADYGACAPATVLDRGVRPAEHAWTCANSNDRRRPVGQLAPTSFALFDLGGNVAEWTMDSYRSINGNRRDATDPWTMVLGTVVLRGGSWDDPLQQVRAGARTFSNANARRTTAGFRLVRSAPAP